MYILNAFVGLAASSKSAAKCGKETSSSCLNDVTPTYRSVCQRSNSKDQCKIRYQDRPNLSGCDESAMSNYSMVEYLCVPGKRMTARTRTRRNETICRSGDSRRSAADRSLFDGKNERSTRHFRCQFDDGRATPLSETTANSSAIAFENGRSRSAVERRLDASPLESRTNSHLGRLSRSKLDLGTNDGNRRETSSAFDLFSK